MVGLQALVFKDKLKTKLNGIVNYETWVPDKKQMYEGTEAFFKEYQEKAKAAGADYVSKEDLFRNADFVTIHLVLSDRSRGLVGAKELGLMKKSAYLINTSRGPIVDEKALIAVLNSKSIAGAGLDVFDIEPLPLDHPFRKMDNVVITPHLGYVSEQNYRKYFPDIVEDIRAWLDGKPVRVIESK